MNYKTSLLYICIVSGVVSKNLQAMKSRKNTTKNQQVIVEDEITPSCFQTLKMIFFGTLFSFNIHSRRPLVWQPPKNS